MNEIVVLFESTEATGEIITGLDVGHKYLTEGFHVFHVKVERRVNGGFRLFVYDNTNYSEVQEIAAGGDPRNVLIARDKVKVLIDIGLKSGRIVGTATYTFDE